MTQMHPYFASQLAIERDRDMLAHTQQQRTARQLIALHRASRRTARAERRAERAQRRARRALRTAARLGTELGH